MDELKPCPFCGGNVSIVRDPAAQINEIFCFHCSAHTKWTIKMKPHETYEENQKRWVEKWNRRAE